MPHISKSSFIRGLQCHKSLYLHFRQPELKDEISQAQQHIFNLGYDVGTTAQQRFPGGIDASRGKPQEVRQALDYTQELIASGQKVIYEGAFSNGQTLCYIDILVFQENRWEAYEVKASTQKRDYHLNDISFQYHAIRSTGLDLTEISLMHLNTAYVRKGDLDVKQLFTTINLTDHAKQMQAEVTAKTLAMQQMLSVSQLPDIPAGSQCTHPFTCDFYGHCHKDIIQESDIFTGVKSVSKAKIEKLRQAGVKSLDDIPDNILFTAKEWVILKGVLNDEINRNKPALDAFVRHLQYPLYFIDFETIQLSIPIYNESRSYQQIPFQYSLHIINSPGEAPVHKEFLGTPPNDPRPHFITNMLEHLGTSGHIIIYNNSFEPPRIRELARDFPDWKNQLLALISRIVDLMVPFRKLHLHTPAMKGSYSIKAVLPALVDDVSYNDLEIQEGGTASLTYQSLYTDNDPTSIATKRKNLIEYCTLDTLAMVELLKKISE